jgi:peptidylprolyl isomerase/peptidyl-prolyl cis-trans isomerase B (cyclophilin B)
MAIELYNQDAPLTVQNFVDLSRQGFYDGLLFHYSRPGDIIMGGDPAGDGTGGSGFFVPAEFNDRKHLAGTVAMVRGSDANSASSQFYICLAPQNERDGLFTVFGQVVEGMDVLTRLGEVATSGMNERPFFRPVEPLIIDSITIQETPAAEAGS